ncbi:MAG: hypothetical protein WD669_06240 [Pirellulales bacterium]
MKFSLKTMLLSLCLLGAAVGMLGNLLIRSPETFFIILGIASTILPFALATGTIMWLGWRGKRRWGLVAWGAVLLLMPVVIQGTLSLFLPSRDPLRVLSNRRLIETRLPGTLNEPWVWREVERRAAGGDLTREDVDAALVQLIAMMKSTRPQGWDQPLSWQRDFIKNAAQANLISDETFLELYDAFYGPQPVVRPVPAVNPRATGFRLEIEYGNPWSDNSSLGVELLWNVAKISVDGKPVTLKQLQRFGENWNGYCEGKFEPGDHEVTVDFDCAYVDPSLLTAPSGKALPTAQWTQTKKRWTTSVSVPVKVEEPQ